ncbi:uncharacterized protein MYCFIDRAFT_189955 [Pseudocercospora fijiensis CIRAD86]|uniref:Tyrosine specific protein phosphatases domain-containing protein n=1 Tax=Pseudocercospora fijiensis (strain CIRAD86) TaxID=383855 RepID=M2ZMT4_PSEFD|nr:uncharacterized protein MYCFIDRAFT_189955 [Pseudocercospora fijiensis CIRAD86]EME80419.1 hypothetical protein MYCFIDRAFT_189955 [Pseudocercospora fijiensis CIRAD86]
MDPDTWTHTPKTEHIEAARKSSSKVPPTPADPAEAKPYNKKDPMAALRVPGTKYESISLNGRPYTNALLKQLSYWNVAKLFTYYSIGYRTDAISILGENVMNKRGLVGLAEDSLKYSKTEIKSVFDVLADSANYPVLVHCTQGKDRTGLTILLVLLLLGLDQHAIEKDYLTSIEGLAADREQRLQSVRSIGLSEEFAGCPKDWVEKVSGYIQDEGGAEEYLQSCGVSSEQLNAIRSILVGAPQQIST